MQPEHDAAVLGVHVEHRAEQLVAVVDQVVGQQHGERLAGGELLAVRDRVAEAARLLLLDELRIVASSTGAADLSSSPAVSPFASSAASSSGLGSK